MEDYKDNIRQTRLNSLGSSDAKMLSQIATMGCIPKSAMKRLAICKGLIPQEDIPYTDAVRFGDETEQAIFEYLKLTNDGYESNPLWVSKVYSRKNLRCITHPDIVRYDHKEKCIYVYECKASKYTTEQVRQEYKCQLYHHWLLAKEQAKEMGNDWKVKLFLVHYQTDGLDLSQPQEFDVNRLVIKPLRMGGMPTFDLAKAMDIVDAYMENLEYYAEDDEIDSAYLPTNVKAQFDAITTTLAEIKQREIQVEEFKAKLFAFMEKQGIKGIKNDKWTITKVDATNALRTDFKALFEQEIASKQPRKAKKLVEKYTKTTKKKGFIQIRLKDNNV